MTRRLLGAVVALLLVGGGCAAPTDAPGADAAPAAPHAAHDASVPAEGRGGGGAAEWRSADDDDALFTVDCPFSHRAADDPIVHPGAPGASHSHEFFGSEVTDAWSTGESLQGTATTCEDQKDTAAYWVPTLSVDGVPVDPTLVRAYYRARAGVDVRDVVAPPTGLAMLAGIAPTEGPPAPPIGDAPSSDDEHHDAHRGHDGHGGSAARPGTGGGWGCGLRPRHLRAEPPTDCMLRAPLTLQLKFPDCWDGEHLDSDDHASHVARSVDGVCPASHPVVMPELQLSVVWPVAGADAARATLSSGPTREAHGDFLNGWAPDALAGHVDLCIHAKVNCTIG